MKVRFAKFGDLEHCVRIDGDVDPEVLRWKVKRGEIIIAEVEGHPVGYLRLDYLWSQLPYIGLIWVVPEYRRRGIGRAMLHFLEAFLRRKGYRWLYSSSQANEPEPQAWHRHMEFQECGFIAGINHGEVGEVFFRKSLTG